jgi:cysteine dioxygenase
MLIERLRMHLPHGAQYSAASLRGQIERLSVEADEVRRYLCPPNGKPYGRALIHQTDTVEVIVMNWAPGETCWPHDHGASFGWAQVLSGAIEHTVYGGEESVFATAGSVRTVERAGALIFAPCGIIHQMTALEQGAGEIVTLHFYSPPISGMRIFDQESLATCVVSDDCGAWWPEPHQMIAASTSADAAKAQDGGVIDREAAALGAEG